LFKEEPMDRQVNTLTLYELNSLVREVLELNMNRAFWVMAELSDVRESRGHCYMELVQFDKNRTPVARASARCWRNTWQLLRPHFERVTGQPLRAGMKVLLEVNAQFHEAYGFSWIITDMNPEFTVGDMQRRRQEIVRQLKEEGVFDLQRELTLPVFAQRIAVISSETAAGYGDFCNQLRDNPYGFVFQTELFPAVMQGEQVEESVIAALNRIYERISSPLTSESSLLTAFDAVVIIRGGGATTDMSGFDTLALAENVANFPLPIITGIGHDRDECILDMVSHIRVKTPTAAAALLIDHLKEVLDTVNNAQNSITRLVQQKLSTLSTQLSSVSEAIPRLFSIVKTRQEAKIDALQQRLPMLIERRFLAENHRLQLMEEKLKALDPQLLLKRGYSITLHKGRAVKDATTLKAGDEIETRLAQGLIHSIVKS
jgi:exodeoxyribonuclease VII large subunit